MRIQVLIVWLVLLTVFLTGVASQSLGTCGSYTDGTCRVYSCGPARGPTRCLGGQCICRPGYCSTGSTCECNAATGKNCLVDACSSTLGPTDCLRHKCECKPGTCSVDGKCFEAPTQVMLGANLTLSTRIAGVNSTSYVVPVFAACAGAFVGGGVMGLAWALRGRGQDNSAYEAMLA
mmetsp:Transcript_57097/g.104907  ORF Transcript_57097/g.104907 Transcript_57097/m.104907 type:complete len:177 (-) Transcript_57097:246-776(-)